MHDDAPAASHSADAPVPTVMPPRLLVSSRRGPVRRGVSLRRRLDARTRRRCGGRFGGLPSEHPSRPRFMLLLEFCYILLSISASSYLMAVSS